MRRHGHHRHSGTRGRPRSPEADRLILTAALRQLRDEGYSRMSMESVAAEAGVGKTTVYRRFQDKADLATAAVAELADIAPMPETGDTRTDLLELVRSFYVNFSKMRGMSMMGTLLVEETRNPELMRLFRERVSSPRRARIKAVLRRGIERGEMRPGLDLEQVTDCLIGSWFAHYLTGLPVRKTWPEEIVDLIWKGIASS